MGFFWFTSLVIKLITAAQLEYTWALRVPPPRGHERQRIVDAFYEKERRCRKASKPITPELLQSTHGKLNQKNLNWIFLTVWLGLRPKEVDGLKNTDLWRAETLFNGKKVIWVYQTKIIALPPEDRWKPISGLELIFMEAERDSRI
jgi:hypothetical protein